MKNEVKWSEVLKNKMYLFWYSELFYTYKQPESVIYTVIHIKKYIMN